MSLDKNMQWVISKMVEIITPCFYGSITISFQAGKVQHIETKRTEKPPAA